MNPNDFYSLIEQRQSDRKFDPDRPVPEDVLQRIIEAGRLSPQPAIRSLGALSSSPIPTLADNWLKPHRHGYWV